MSTAMTNRLQSPVGFDCAEWASDLSVAASRPIGAVIPRGTVASRIIDLQNLAKSSMYNGPPSTTNRRRESSRTGFGRRTTARFGQPASRSSRPDEQLEVDVQHAFLGLAARRSNHMEEHAVVDRRTKLDRTAGLHAQLMPSGRCAGVPYEVTSPWAFLPSSQSRRDILRQNERYPDDVYDSATELDDLVPVPALSSQPADGAAEKGTPVAEKELGQIPDLWTRPRNPHQQRPEPSSGSFSTETTSTMRRQSVRDLYAYYGIRRPPGLVSSESVAGDSKDTPEWPRKYICCHVCFSFNSLKSAYCKCGHQICAACEGILSDTGTRSSRGVDRTGSTPRPRCGHVESKTASNIPSEPKIETKAPNQGKLPNGHQLVEELHDDRPLGNPSSVPGHGQCDLGGSVPTLRVEGATPHRGPGEHIRACKELFDSVVQNQGSSTTSGDPKLITASTLLSTDALLPGYSLGLLPVAMNMGHQPDQASRCTYHPSRPQHHKSQSNSLSDMDAKEYIYHGENLCYKVTHSGHARFRENGCPRKKRRRPDETDSGYAAGVSHHDERNTMGPESGSLEENLRRTCLDHGARKAFKQHSRATAAPQSEIKCSKQAHSPHLQKSATCSLGSTPSVVKHTDIHLPPKAGYVHNGNPVISGSIRSKQYQNQCMHDLSRCTHYDGRCYGRSDHESSSSSHTVRQDQRSDSFRMTSQTQNHTSSPKASPRGSSSETTNDTDRPIATLISQKNNITELPGTIEVPNAESQDASAQGIPAAHKQRFSKETFMSLKRKFENEKSELEAAHPPEAVPPYSINQANPSPELNNRLKLSKYRPSNESISSTANPPSGVCSSHKSKSTSRRLSAFFRLQEQNIVSTLNKRLQEHQEALKRMDRLCKDQLNSARRKKSSIVEEGGRHEAKKRNEEQLARSDEELANKSEDCVPSRQEQRKMQDGRLQEEKETTRNENGQEVMLLGLDTPKIVVETHWDGEHRHRWKRMVVRSTARTVDSPGKIQEERFVGVNGITITIHMDGREDIVIKADLSG